MNDLEYMTRKEAMAYLKVKRNKFDAFVRAGMPHKMFGRQRRFNAEAIDEWIEKGGGDLREGKPTGRSDESDGQGRA